MDNEEFKEYYARLNNIFRHLDEEWLENGQYNEEEFINCNYFKMAEISYNELSDQISLIDKKFGFRKELACRKLKALLDFLTHQVSAWKGFSDEKKQSFRDYYETTGFPFIYLCEKFTSTVAETKKIEKKEVKKQLRRLKSEEFEEQRKEVDYYFRRFSILIKNPRVILTHNLSSNFAQKLLETSSFKDAQSKIEGLCKLIDSRPAKKDLIYSASVSMNYNLFIENLNSLKQQVLVFKENLDIFQANGKTIIKNQLQIPENFFTNHNIFFIHKEVKSENMLIDIIYEYILFHGLIWLYKLMDLKPVKDAKDFNQNFFKKMGLYIASPSEINSLPSGPNEGPIKTIKQGRQLSMAQTLKKEKIIGIKNSELSKYELIQRIEDNLKIIRITCRNLINSPKVPSKQKLLAQSILERNTLIKTDRLTQYELSYLQKLADAIYGDFSTCKNLGLKLLK